MRKHNDAVNDPEVLEALYWHEGLPMWKIAERLGCSETTVYRRMAQYGIDRKGVGYNYKSGRQDNEVRFYTRHDGYEIVSHSHDGENQAVYFHQLVMIAAGGDPHKVFSEEYHTHHINELKYDNRPSNLKLMRGEEHNRHHAKKNGLGHEREYQREEMLDWLQSFTDHFGFVPTHNDLKGWPGPSAQTYRNEFGSFPAAVKAAGYTPRSER